MGKQVKNPLAKASNPTLITVQSNGQMKHVAFKIFICRENFDLNA